MGGNKDCVYLLFAILLAGGIYHAEAFDGFFDSHDGRAANDALFDIPKPAVYTQIIKLNENMTQAVDESTYSATDTADGPVLFEGDIVETPNLKAKIAAMEAGGIGMFDAINRGQWPKAEVPYTYRKYAKRTLKGAVDQAVYEYKTKTCIKWIEYTPTQIYRRNIKNYVEFFIGGGCYSMIGIQRGKQQISLGRGCNTKGIAIHEMMHALGFFHEQSRRDRDTYIYIDFRNIPSRVAYNFRKYRVGQADTQGEPYDKKSIMHYGNYAFSTNRKMTIISRKNRNERLGQRKGLSKIDINQLRKYYKCGKKTGVVTPTGKKCKDVYSFCVALSNHCHHAWVKKHCKNKCNLCGTTKTCKDKEKAKNCIHWKKQDFCTRRYVDYMAGNCAKTCGKC